MKKVLIIIGLLICTCIFLWLGVNALDAAFMEYTGITAAVSGLASVVYFIFGYKGCTLIVERLTKWIGE
jgi:uncharacterized membrane protein YtjA (UPF0391 family)